MAAAASDIADHRLLIVVTIDPLKTVLGKIKMMQDWIPRIKPGQIGKKPGYPFMPVNIHQIPIQGTVHTPLAPMRKLVAHEIELFTGVRHLVAK